MANQGQGTKTIITPSQTSLTMRILRYEIEKGLGGVYTYSWVDPGNFKKIQEGAS